MSGTVNRAGTAGSLYASGSSGNDPVTTVPDASTSSVLAGAVKVLAGVIGFVAIIAPASYRT